jgi:hypothetical protein
MSENNPTPAPAAEALASVLWEVGMTAMHGRKPDTKFENIDPRQKRGWYAVVESVLKTTGRSVWIGRPTFCDGCGVIIKESDSGK